MDQHTTLTYINNFGRIIELSGVLIGFSTVISHDCQVYLFISDSLSFEADSVSFIRRKRSFRGWRRISMRRNDSGHRLRLRHHQNQDTMNGRQEPTVRGKPLTSISPSPPFYFDFGRAGVSYNYFLRPKNNQFFIRKSPPSFINMDINGNHYTKI